MSVVYLLFKYTRYCSGNQVETNNIVSFEDF